MKQETLNLIANIDENTIILPKSEGGVYEMYQMDSIADLRKASRNFMRTEKILESIDAKTSAASELVAGIVTEARIKEISKALDPIQATELVAGIIKIATTAQVTAGTDNTTAVSPAKLKEIFVNGSTKTQNGYQKLPGGVIMQWGMVADNGNVVNVTFPVAFPTSCASLQITRGGGTAAFSTGSPDAGASVILSMSNIGFSVDSVMHSSDKSLVYYVAIGY